MRQFCLARRPLPADDATYFRARAVQEQVAAHRASCSNARASHGQLAAMYRFRAAMLANPMEPARWVEGLETCIPDQLTVLESIAP